jgi:hypothetical protein
VVIENAGFIDSSLIFNRQKRISTGKNESPAACAPALLVPISIVSVWAKFSAKFAIRSPQRRVAIF